MKWFFFTGYDKGKNYHRPSDRIGQYQAITSDDAVECAVCHAKVTFVYELDSDDGSTIRVCTSCSEKVLGGTTTSK